MNSNTHGQCRIKFGGKWSNLTLLIVFLLLGSFLCYMQGIDLTAVRKWYRSSFTQYPHSTVKTPDLKTLAKRNSRRKQLLQGACKKFGKGPVLNPNNIPKEFTVNMYVSKQHKLLYCTIPKVASSNWKRILMLLSGRLKLLDPEKANYTYKYPHTPEARKVLVPLNNFGPKQRKLILKNYLKFMFVREPMSRLYSAYKDKFVRQSPFNDYFKFAFGKVIAKTYRPRTSNKNITGRDIKFEEFIRFITDEKMSDRNMNIHWQTFERICRPCAIKYDIIGKYETLVDDASLVFYRSNAKGMDFLNAPKNSHSSSVFDIFKNISNKYFPKLREKYKIDYALFNYSFPLFLRKFL